MNRRRLHGFVLSYALRWVVFGAVMVGVSVFALSNSACGCKPSKELRAKVSLHKLAVALEDYRADFHAFPPDNFPSVNASENLWHYIGTKLPAGSTTFGPYAEFTEYELRDIPNSPNKKVVSPLGADYHYILRVDSKGQPNSYLLIDPGKDQEPGGHLDPEKGFIVEDEKKAADNLTAPEN